jgi:hypothetical protein
MVMGLLLLLDMGQGHTSLLVLSLMTYTLISLHHFTLVVGVCSSVLSLASLAFSWPK